MGVIGRLLHGGRRAVPAPARPNGTAPDGGPAPAAAGGGARRAARVTLIGKPGCHLCDDARAVIARVADELRVGWEERDITADAELYARYAEQIPVTLVDGAQHDFWRVDEHRLRTALRQPARL